MLKVYEKDRMSFPEFFNDKFFKELEAEEEFLKT